MAYTIVFQVDLTTVNSLNGSKPNENHTQATLAAQRSTWIPEGFLEGSENRAKKHGDVFTVTNDHAYYLKRNYVQSAANPYGVLKIVSEA